MKSLSAKNKPSERKPSVVGGGTRADPSGQEVIRTCFSGLSFGADLGSMFVAFRGRVRYHKSSRRGGIMKLLLGGNGARVINE